MPSFNNNNNNNNNTHTHTQYPFNGLFQGNPGKPASESQTILDFTEERDDGGGSGISWAIQIICTSLQTAPHHSVNRTRSTPVDPRLITANML